MMRWQYMRTLDMDGEAMSRHGYVGWELVAVVQRVNGHGYLVPDLYWKRPIPHQPHEETSRER